MFSFFNYNKRKGRLSFFVFVVTFAIAYIIPVGIFYLLPVFGISFKEVGAFEGILLVFVCPSVLVAVIFWLLFPVAALIINSMLRSDSYSICFWDFIQEKEEIKAILAVGAISSIVPGMLFEGISDTTGDFLGFFIISCLGAVTAYLMYKWVLRATEFFINKGIYKPRTIEQIEKEMLSQRKQAELNQAMQAYYSSEYYKQTGIIYPDVFDSSSSHEHPAKVAGNRFEYVVGKEFEKLPGALVLYDVILPEENGGFQEIDQIVLFKDMILVVEAKGYSGRIIVDYTNKKCRHEKKDGTVEEVNNPLFQNYNHVKALNNYLYEHVKQRSNQSNQYLWFIRQNIINKVHSIIVSDSASLQFPSQNVKETTETLEYYHIPFSWYSFEALVEEYIPELMKYSQGYSEPTIKDILLSIPRYSKDEKQRLFSYREALFEADVLQKNYRYYFNHNPAFIARTEGYTWETMNVVPGDPNKASYYWLILPEEALLQYKKNFITIPRTDLVKAFACLRAGIPYKA